MSPHVMLLIVVNIGVLSIFWNLRVLSMIIKLALHSTYEITTFTELANISL